MKNKNVQKISIQTKLIAVFLLTSLVLLAVNLVLHQSMNRMTQRIDQVYAVNVSLNELQQVLDQVQDAMTEYLNTKSSDSMEDYYKYEQEYRRLSQELNQDISSQERKIMEKNTVIGADLLANLKMYEDEPLMKTAWQNCRWHHERYDGKGYPDGLVGEEIPIAAQVVALADVYDALTSERVYKKAFSHEKSIEMIKNGECGAFNPLLLETMCDIQDKIKT